MSAKGIGRAIEEVGGTGTLTVLAGVTGFGVITGVLVLVYVFNGSAPTEGWVAPYSFCALFAGVGAGLKVGQRATAKPEVVRAEAEAEALKIVAKADAEERLTGSFPVVTALREDVP